MKNLIRIITLALIFTNIAAYSENYMRLLKEGSLSHKIKAMHHLGYSGNKKAFWPMVKYLSYSPVYKDKDFDSKSRLAIKARAAAAEALGRLKDKRAVPYLVKQLEVEENIDVKRQIIFALSFYKTESKKFATLLRKELKNTNKEIRFEIVLTIASTSDKQFEPDITSLLTTEKDEAIKLAAAFALVQMGVSPRENARLLTAALKSDKPVQRYWGAYLLGKTDRIETITALVKAQEIENRYWVQVELDRSLMFLYQVVKEKRARMAESDYSFLDDKNKEEKVPVSENKPVAEKTSR